MAKESLETLLTKVSVQKIKNAKGKQSKKWQITPRNIEKKTIDVSVRWW